VGDPGKGLPTEAPKPVVSFIGAHLLPRVGLSNPLAVMERNGTAEVLGALSVPADCLSRLANLSALSGAVGATRGNFGLDPKKPAASGVLDLDGIVRALETSGTGLLLASFPVGPGSLIKLGQLSLVAVSLANVRRVFQIDLLQPDASALLATKLQGLNARGLDRLSLPRLPASGMTQLSDLAAARASIRSGLNIDLRSPGAGTRIKESVDRMHSAGILPALRSFPVPMPTLTGLGRFTSFAMSLQTLRLGLNLDPLAPNLGTKLPHVTKLIEAGGPLHSICSQVVAGSIGPGSAIRLPDSKSMAELTKLLAGIKLTRQDLGIDLLAPDAGSKLQGLFDTLRANGTCKGLEGVRMEPADLEGIVRLQAFASGMQATQNAGVNPFQPGAALNLVRVVDGFQGNGTTTALESASVPSAVVDGLSRLASIASAAEGLAGLS
jgi:hypothetical protein